VPKLHGLPNFTSLLLFTLTDLEPNDIFTRENHPKYVMDHYKNTVDTFGFVHHLPDPLLGCLQGRYCFRCWGAVMQNAAVPIGDECRCLTCLSLTYERVFLLSKSPAADPIQDKTADLAYIELHRESKTRH